VNDVAPLQKTLLEAPRAYQERTQKTFLIFPLPVNKGSCGVEH
jgi:hypothetical protein